MGIDLPLGQISIAERPSPPPRVTLVVQTDGGEQTIEGTRMEGGVSFDVPKGSTILRMVSRSADEEYVQAEWFGFRSYEITEYASYLDTLPTARKISLEEAQTVEGSVYFTKEGPIVWD